MRIMTLANPPDSILVVVKMWLKLEGEECGRIQGEHILFDIMENSMADLFQKYAGENENDYLEFSNEFSDVILSLSPFQGNIFKIKRKNQNWVLEAGIDCHLLEVDIYDLGHGVKKNSPVHISVARAIQNGEMSVLRQFSNITGFFL